MPDPKQRPQNELRTPKQKKRLGLSVPPALRLPHEDLIRINDQAPDPASTSPETVADPATVAKIDDKPTQSTTVAPIARDESHARDAKSATVAKLATVP